VKERPFEEDVVSELHRVAGAHIPDDVVLFQLAQRVKINAAKADSPPERRRTCFCKSDQRALAMVNAGCVGIVAAPRPPHIDQLDFRCRRHGFSAAAGHRPRQHRGEERAPRNVLDAFVSKQKGPQRGPLLREGFRFFVVKWAHVDAADAGAVEKCGRQPCAQRLDPVVPRRCDNFPASENGRLQDRVEEIEHDAAIGNLDPVDSINEQNRRARRGNLDKKSFKADRA
jgi:hypothetical protein